MRICTACQQQLGDAARFCPQCGVAAELPAAVASAVGNGSLQDGHDSGARIDGPVPVPAPAPQRSAPDHAGFGGEAAWHVPPPSPWAGAPGRAPQADMWLAALRGDWLLVAITVLLLVVGVALVGALYGAALAFLATERPESLLDGARAGVYLLFSSLGAGVEVEAGRGLALEIRGMPLVLAGLLVAGTLLALRFAERRLPDEELVCAAFVPKLALALALAVATTAALLSFDGQGAGSFRADVSVGPALLAAPALVVAVALVRGLRARRLASLMGRQLGERVAAILADRRVRDVAEGLRAFLLLAVLMGTGAALTAVLRAEDVQQGALVALCLPLLGGGLAAGATVLAMGGSVALGETVGGAAEDPISLWSWEALGGRTDAAAPLPLFLLLFAAPVVVHLVTRRRLRRLGPQDEQAGLQTGFAIAVGFTVSAWLAALTSPLVISATARGSEHLALAASPSPGAAFGLGLLWSLIGALGAALLWARQRGIGWLPRAAITARTPLATSNGTTSWGGDSDLAPPPPQAAWADSAGASPRPPHQASEQPHARPRSCPSCQTANRSGAAFCSGCGSRIP